MDKFKSFSVMTNDHLDGELINMRIDYDNENEMKLVITYRFNNYFEFNYEVLVNTKKQQIKFLKHGTNRAFEKINMSPDKSFNNALESYFFHH